MVSLIKTGALVKIANPKKIPDNKTNIFSSLNLSLIVLPVIE